MACDMFPVGMGDSACTENYAGTGTVAYLFAASDVDKDSLAVDEKLPMYKTFALKDGAKIYPVALKVQANKVDGSGLGPNKGFSNVATIVAERDLDRLAVLQRTVNNKRCGLLLKKPGTASGAYILWNESVDTTFEFADTTGDTFDSDNTSTWTVTSAPMPYSRMYIPEDQFTALTVAEETADSGGAGA